MPIAWRTDYAIRIAYELTRLGPDARCSIAVLSESADVPYDFARQIANKLARSGLLVSRRGSQGGFALARAADEISLLDVFVAMDEKPTMSLCTYDEHACRRTDDCPVHNGVWKRIDAMIERELATMTLADCVAEGGVPEALNGASR